MRANFEYQTIPKENVKRPRVLGEIDLLVRYGSTLCVLELKTNNDLSGAAAQLSMHSKHQKYLLESLPPKFTKNIRQIVYFAIIYEAYLAYTIHRGHILPDSGISIDDFIANFDELLESFNNPKKS